MIIGCPACGRRYSFDPAKLAGRTEATLRCSACQATIPLVLDAAAPEEDGGDAIPAAPVAAAPPPGAAEHPGDRTTRLPLDASRVAQAPPGPQEGAAALPEGRRVSLAVLGGRDSGRIFAVERPSLVIGRGDADINLEDPEVSRHHARIEVRGAQLFVRDLGSTNGTFVDDQKVTEALIDERGEFRVGQTRMMLILAAAESTAQESE